MPSAAASSADGCPPRASPPVTAVGNAAAAVRDSPSQHEDEKGKSLTAAASAVHENPDLAEFMPPNWHKGVAHCRDAYRSKFGEELTGHFDTAVEAALAYARRAQTAAAARGGGGLGGGGVASRGAAGASCAQEEANGCIP